MAIPANQRQRLANMKMGEHMGRRPVAPQQKKNDGVLEKIGGALSTAGGWITGGATKEQLTSPAYYAKGLANTVNDFVIQPAWRTASGQNVQTLFSPDASLNQRINAVGEDAINIASLFTGGAAKGVATGMQAAENSLARMMAGQGVRQAIRAGTRETGEAAARVAAEEAFKTGSRAAMGGKPTVPVSPRTQQMYEGRAAAASADAAEALERARTLRTATDRPEWSELIDNPDMLRLFHSSPEGQALPPQLLSLKDAARLHGRRGDGSGMLLDGGLYATDSGYMSATYPTPATPPRIPIHIEDVGGKLVSTPSLTRQDVVGFDSLDIDAYRAAMSNALLDAVPSSTAKMAPSDVARIKDLLKYENLELTKPLENLFNSNSAATYEDLLRAWPYDIDLLKRGLQSGVKYQPDVADVINVGGKPIYAAPDLPAYILDGDSAMSGSMASRAGSEFRKNYVQKRIDEIEQDFEREIQRNADYLAILLREKPSRAFDYKWIQDRNRRVQNAYAVRDIRLQAWKDRNSPTREQMNRVFGEPRVGVEGQWKPGTNYWDLPVTRSADGAIESIAGMPAMDIGKPTPELVDRLKGAFKTFLDRYGVSDKDAAEVYETLDEMLGDGGSFGGEPLALFKFRSAISTAKDIAAEGRFSAIGNPDNFSTKEELYETLQNVMGYEAMPHPGGVTTSTEGIRHQAVSFTRPELLPPSTYIPSTSSLYTQAMDDYNRALVNKYFAGRHVGKPSMPALNAMQGRASQKEMANRLAAAAWFSNQGINSMYGGSNR